MAVLAKIAMLKRHPIRNGGWLTLNVPEALVKEMDAEVVGMPAPSASPAADEYGSDDFGFTFAGIHLEDGDKRLMAMLVRAFGTDHPAVGDLTALLFRSRSASPARSQPSAKALTVPAPFVALFDAIDSNDNITAAGIRKVYAEEFAAARTLLAAEQPSEDKRAAAAKGFVPVSERRLGDDGYCIGCDCHDIELDPCSTAVRQAEERRAAIAKGEGA